MNPMLYGMIFDSARGGSYGHGYHDPLPGRILLGLLLALLGLIGWGVHEHMQWTEVSRSNVWLRVAATDGDRKFTPVLVDDVTGQRFAERIGGKHCNGGPAALPVGATILAGVVTWRDKRDGHHEHTLDTADLERRIC